MADSLEIRLLGEPEVIRNGKRLALPASKKTRALLAYLIASEKMHLRETLCTLLWEGPDDPRAALRWSLTKIRPLLDGPRTKRLQADRDRAGFERNGADVDLVAVRAATGRDLATATTEALRAAASRFRGPFLEGLDLPGAHKWSAWVVGERETTRALHVAVRTALIDRLATAQPEEALTHARALLALDPLSEWSHILVVRLLGALGRTREAMEQYERCRKILESELGARPSAELERVRMALGRGTARVELAASSIEISSPTPALEKPRATIPIVGRSRERAVIAGLLEDLRSGGPSAGGKDRDLLLILGEPGVGKSRLLEELRAQATSGSVTLLVGRGFEAELVRPYGVWIDALRGSSLGGASVARRADLAALLPELGVVPQGQDRTRLFDAVAATLRDLCATAPVVVMLDDLQWVDEASAALLHFALRALSGAPILFTCTARTGELGDNPAVLKVVRALERERRLLTLSLAPLDAAETAELARLVAPSVDAARIFAESEGNPLFALEIARALAAGETNPADTLAGLIGHRLARFEGIAHSVLAFSAALGRNFDVDVLGRVTGVAPADLVTALEVLERHGVVRAAGASAYDFIHDLVRRAAYQQLSEPRRRLVHAQIARALAATPDSDGALAGEISHHAGLGGDADLAARACVTAGSRCLRLFAYSEARELGQRGIRHAERLPLRERLPLEIELFGLQVQAIRGRRALALEADLARAVVAARGAGLSEAESRGLHFLALLQYEAENYTGAEETSLRRAQAGRGGVRGETALELAGSARCFALLEREIGRAEALIEEARAAAGPDVELLDVFWARGLVRQFGGDTGGAVADLERAATLASRFDLHWEQCDCLMRLALIDLERGRPAAALAWCDRLAGVAGKMGDGAEGPMAATLAALAHRMLGQPGADGQLATALDDLRAADAKAMLSIALNLWAETFLESGDTSRATVFAREALEAASVIRQRSQEAIAHGILARLAAVARDAKTALAHLEAGTAHASEPHAISARARSVLASARAVVGVNGAVSA